MSYFVRKLDGIAAANHTVDIIAELPGIHNDGPCFAGVSYWVHTPGGVSAGGYRVELRWLDPTGTLRTLSGADISLQDGAAIIDTPVQILERETEITQFEVVTVLNGVADGALVSYRVMFTNTDGSDLSFFNNN